MRAAQDIACEKASGLDRARRALRAQLNSLVRLAAIALRLIDTIAAAPARASAHPFSGVSALETSVRRYAKVSWALRLIAALRTKLEGDLARVERGETVEIARPSAPKPAKAPAPPPLSIAEQIARLKAEIASGHLALERERPERESFGPHVSRAFRPDEFAEILKRPTEEVLALIREALGLSAEEDEEAEAPEVPFPLDGGRVRVGGGALSARARPAEPPRRKASPFHALEGITPRGQQHGVRRGGNPNSVSSLSRSDGGDREAVEGFFTPRAALQPIGSKPARRPD